MKSLLLSLLFLAVANAAPIKVGETFPEVQLPLVGSDDSSTIGSYRGQKVILYLFASW